MASAIFIAKNMEDNQLVEELNTLCKEMGILRIAQYNFTVMMELDLPLANSIFSRGRLTLYMYYQTISREESQKLKLQVR